MDAESARQRLRLSETVIDGWEALGGPGGSIADNLRMIRQELDKLRDLARDAPELNERIDEIAYRYRLLEERLRTKLN